MQKFLQLWWAGWVAFWNILGVQKAKFSPTMVDWLRCILNHSREQNTTFSKCLMSRNISLELQYTFQGSVSNDNIVFKDQRSGLSWFWCSQTLLALIWFQYHYMTLIWLSTTITLYFEVTFNEVWTGGSLRIVLRGRRWKKTTLLMALFLLSYHLAL